MREVPDSDNETSPSARGAADPAVVPDAVAVSERLTGVWDFEMFEQEQKPEAHLLRWFLTAGLMGIVVATVLTILSIYDAVPTPLLLTLWPSSILGLVDPHTLAEELGRGYTSL